MPRGQYDRNKTKEQRAAEKAPVSKKAPKTTTATAAPAKRKYTKKATGGEKDFSTGPQKGTGKGGLIGQAMSRDNDFFLLQEARHNIHTLMTVAEQFGDLPSVKEEVEAHVRFVGKLRERVLGDVAEVVAGDEDVGKTSDDEDEGDGEPEKQANGAEIRQASVQLPPPPAIAPPPVIPAH